MRLIQNTLISCCLSFPSIVFAGEEVDETRGFVGSGKIEVIVMRGELDIEGWDESRISVSGEIDDLADKFVFEVDGDRALIEVRMPRHDVNWGDGSDLQIRVPHDSILDVDTVATDIDIDDVFGGMRIQTVSGDLELHNVAGQILARTVSGDIELTGKIGDASVNTVSGDMEIEMEGTELMVESVSGSADVRLTLANRFIGKSVSGDIDFEGELPDSGEIDVSSVSGDIDLALTGSPNANVRAEAGPGGDIINRITDDKPHESMLRRQNLNAKIGNGGGLIRMKNVSGDLLLRSED